MFEPQFLSQKTKTTCPYCGVGCGVVADTSSGDGLNISGDKSHPANYGRLCSKGSALAETIGLDGRLLYPTLHGEKTSWDAALNLIADKFATTIKEHGPDSVAFYVSGQILTEDYYIANKLMKGFIGSANIDTNSRLCMASSVAGHKKAFGADTVPGTYEDFEKSDLVILVGSNLAWCHPVIYQRLAAAKEKRPEMKVVLVDPRRTMTADIADIHLAIKPDGDVALFMGLLSHLEKTGLLDHGYIENYTNGAEEALACASGVTLEQISGQTGLTETELQDFYALFSRTEKTVTVYSQGVNQSACGVDKVSAIINCHLATGRIGKEGMGPFSVTGQPNAMGGRETGGLANMLAAHMDIENPDHRNLVQSFWNSPVIADKAGLKAIDMFKAVDDGRIKAIWIMATNPVDSLPDADMVEAALIKCPFVVVSDILQTTDTVRHAHIALPSLGWGEKDGTVTNSERRISRQRAFLAPPGEAKADWWQMAEVGKRMGFEEAFSYRSARDVFVEHAELSDTDNNGIRDFDIGAYKGLSEDLYQNLSPFQWPQPSEKPSNKDTRFFARGNFYTPSRKANLIPVNMPTRVVEDKDFPFVLNTGRVRDHWHTMTRTGKSQRLSAHIIEPFVEIHPDDASDCHISADQIVEVSSPRGRVLGRAEITKRAQKGAVFVPIHWTDQFTSLGRIGSLIPSVIDPTSGQPAFKRSSVKISPFKAQYYGLAVSRHKPEIPPCAYWALSKCESGWRLEFAGDEEDINLREFVTLLYPDMKDGQYLDYEDSNMGDCRLAVFNSQRLDAVLYKSTSPIGVSRSFASEALLEDYEEPMSRQFVMAGRYGKGRIEKGDIVCSCFSVGLNQIESFIQSKGSASVKEVGDALEAGTNCGSCRSEIQSIIDSCRVLETEKLS